jgi:predicted ATP-dependent serine protease
MKTTNKRRKETTRIKIASKNRFGSQPKLKEFKETDRDNYHKI